MENFDSEGEFMIDDSFLEIFTYYGLAISFFVAGFYYLEDSLRRHGKL